MKNSNLDERQEQTLLKIEHNGCWIAFWGLLAALIVEQILFGPEFRYIAGEWIVFMVMAIYLAVDCLRNGIWDRRMKANGKSVLAASAIAGLVFGAVMFVIIMIRYPGHLAGSASAALIGFAMTFVLCFIVLSLSAKSYKKRIEKLEQEPEEEE